MTRVKLPECVELHERVPRLPECVEAVEGVQSFQPQKIRRSKSNGRPRSGVRSKKSLPPLSERKRAAGEMGQTLDRWLRREGAEEGRGQEGRG